MYHHSAVDDKRVAELVRDAQGHHDECSEEPVVQWDSPKRKENIHATTTLLLVRREGKKNLLEIRDMSVND